jgi:flagellar motor switch/type III secretory pathway protein FliN
MDNQTQADASLTSSADQSAETSSERGDGGASALLTTREGGELPGVTGMEALRTDSVLAGLPLQLDVTIPIPLFRVEDLLGLEKGTVLESSWPHTDDVPVWCGGSQLAWTEFEVVDDKLAVRVTRIS